MNIRELLKIEVWSKRTSRKILVGLAIFVAVFVIFFFVDKVWITQGEREAAGSALLLIDSLQSQYSEDDQKDFDVRERKAQEAVDAAKHAAWTSRDKQISFALLWCLVEVEADRGQLKTDKLIQQRHIVFKNPGLKLDPNLSYAIREQG